jgi:predicted HicB family RNase H-like nuclease
MGKNMNQYTTIQVNKELHSELKKFCKERGYSLSGLVESLIKERIKISPNPDKVLSVKT